MVLKTAQLPNLCLCYCLVECVPWPWRISRLLWKCYSVWMVFNFNSPVLSPQFDSNTCKCVCAVGHRFCGQRRKWDPQECKCKCRTEIKCNYPYKRDETSCQCVNYAFGKAQWIINQETFPYVYVCVYISYFFFIICLFLGMNFVGSKINDSSNCLQFAHWLRSIWHWSTYLFYDSIFFSRVCPSPEKYLFVMNAQVQTKFYFKLLFSVIFF